MNYHTIGEPMKQCTVDLHPDGGFSLGLPSTTTEAYHHVHIPASKEGLNILLRILNDRHREERKTIGTNGSPIQQQVEAWLAAERRERQAQPLNVAGIDVGELDL